MEYLNEEVDGALSAQKYEAIILQLLPTSPQLPPSK
jgi:hypothetical protein